MILCVDGVATGSGTEVSAVVLGKKWLAYRPMVHEVIWNPGAVSVAMEKSPLMARWWSPAVDR
jgi:hypothetical protein